MTFEGTDLGLGAARLAQCSAPRRLIARSPEMRCTVPVPMPRDLATIPLMVRWICLHHALVGIPGGNPHGNRHRTRHLRNRGKIASRSSVVLDELPVA